MKKFSKFLPRTEFNYDKKLFWRPGHQVKAMNRLEKGLGHIDIVVEVRDARIPISSANLQFERALGKRDRLVIFNKTDLSNPNMQKVHYLTVATCKRI